MRDWVIVWEGTASGGDKYHGIYVIRAETRDKAEEIAKVHAAERLYVLTMIQSSCLPEPREKVEIMFKECWYVG